jgi:stearoyl-CoA desaturase (delta-9 desaturase)
VHGVLWAHVGWFLTPRNNALSAWRVRDWMKFPELLWLERAAPLVALFFAAAVYGSGELVHAAWPELRTDGLMLLVWVFFISTVALYHATYSVNSLAHLAGSRRYETRDQSRNNLLVALITLGEGWHNNHHFYPSSARQGFFWWEIDPTFYLLLALARLGLVWDLRPVPPNVR